MFYVVLDYLGLKLEDKHISREPYRKVTKLK